MDFGVPEKGFWSCIGFIWPPVWRRGVDPGGQGGSRPNENIGGGGKHIVLPPNNFDNLKNS